MASTAPEKSYLQSQQQQQASTNYKEAFALFDKRGNGRVALESLGDLLRACGQNPTLAEISDLEKSVGGDCKSQSRIRATVTGPEREKGVTVDYTNK